MPFTRNEYRAGIFLLVLLVSAPFRGTLTAQEEPAWLSIIAPAGIILLDDDTVSVEGETQLQITAGEHVLSFYPYHTADVWVPRYLIYPFSVGPSGHRSLDLTKNDIFSIRAEPEVSLLSYRGRYLGRTPGNFFLLTGTGDSVLVHLPGFQTKTLYIDRLKEYGNELFVSLEPQIIDETLEEEQQVYQYRSPLRKLMTPELMLSFSAGVALVASGVHFNQEADRYYASYQRLLGTRAREEAYSKMRRNDRLSKITIISGDISLGYFGYVLIRRFVLPARHRTPDSEGSGLSLNFSPGKAGLALKF